MQPRTPPQLRPYPARTAHQTRHQPRTNASVTAPYLKRTHPCLPVHLTDKGREMPACFRVWWCLVVYVFTHPALRFARPAQLVPRCLHQG